MLSYNIARNEDGTTSVSVVIDGKIYLASDTHPNYSSILDALLELSGGDWDDSQDTPEEYIASLFDVSFTVGQQFQRLSDRVSVSGGKIYLDGEEIDNALTQAILRFSEEGQDFQPLVNFFEKIENNPNPHSREHLYRWLNTNRFTIHDDGDFLAYKGLSTNNHSINSGGASVDGEWVEGTIPNLPGSVIEMPRSKVEFDPANGCSTGLHAATFQFATGFGQGVVVQVKVNPRDVVSVPVDSGDEKLRVCRYAVLSVVRQPNRSAYQADDGYDEYEDEEPYEVEEHDEVRPASTTQRIVSRVQKFFGPRN